ncbi:hypothetical protein, partial [Arenibacter sp. F20364]|uniref:hypothetical protein n=1 Tax=Arenibacter sp. F20364 TaxID=2926415 RepID=UPI001FF2A1CF
MGKRTFKSKHYKYPTLEERNRLKEKLPDFIRFKFDKINPFESIFGLKNTLEETSTKNNLHYWNITLSNRLGKLKETYIFLLTHFDRGFKENHLNCNDKWILRTKLRQAFRFHCASDFGSNCATSLRDFG